MVRPGRSNKDAPKPKTVAPPMKHDMRIASRLATQSTSPLPVRTIIKVELGDTPQALVHSAIADLMKMHKQNTPNHPVYICPMRNGKVTSEPVFEAQILGFVNELCEVKDGAIALKTAPVDVDVKSFTL